MNKIENMNPTTEFGKWLHERIVERKWNCSIVAKKLHTSRQMIWNHITGRSEPSYVWCVAYSMLFDKCIHPDDIWYEILKKES